MPASCPVLTKAMNQSANTDSWDDHDQPTALCRAAVDSLVSSGQVLWVTAA
jgi:hypothetical protein